MGRGAQLLDDIHDVHPTAGAKQAIDTVDLASDFLAITFGHAAGCDQVLTSAFMPG
jgi:hypothetical protein